MFFGMHQSPADEKGTLTIPEKWRAELAQGYVLTRGLDQCVLLFPRSRFLALTERIEELGMEASDARTWTRFLSTLATDAEIDKHGHLVVPAALREFAELGNEVNLVGAFSRIEIWNPAKYEHLDKQRAPEMSQIAERLHPMLRPAAKKNND